MSKRHRKSHKKIQSSPGETRQSVISEGGKKLLERPSSEIRLLVGLLVVVCILVVAVHWPALSARALSFDDSQYLTDNLLVQNPGLVSSRRFLSEVLEPSTVGGYYQPLSMISLMLDYALGGRADNLRPFHRTSLALHAANTALVSVLLYLLFGQAWVVAGVGLLFGLHPMTVEPIPWVGERKTLLAAFFALWSLILYVLYTRKSDWKLYIGCLVMYVLALMSKPTSTPLPLLMLLMDYWPLRRLKWLAVLEKLPFFVVGVISAVITYVSQSHAAPAVVGGGYGLGRIPLVLCHNIIFYLHKIIWPANLSSHYAFPVPLALSEPMVVGGVIGTCVLIVLLVISVRWTPAVLSGWLFFFVAILPTLQIIGFSNVIASDKFAYLPSTGLLMLLVSFLVWFCGTGGAGRLGVRRVLVIAAVLILAGAEAVATRRYLVHWRDTENLFEHMLTVTPDAAPVHDMLGLALKRQGKIDEAIRHYRKALRIKPRFSEAHNNLGSALRTQGKLDEAVSHFRQALQIRPDNAKAHYNFGNALQSQGKLDEAVRHYRKALEVKPEYVKAHNNLSTALATQGKLDEAIRHCREALRIKPDIPEAHNNLGRALMAQGKLDEAISHFRQALQMKPDLAEAYINLGSVFKAQGKLDESTSQFRQALEINPDSADAHNHLGSVLVSQYKLDEAIGHFREALRVKPNEAEVLNNLGSALAAQGRLDEAIVCFRRAVQIKPDFAKAHRNLRTAIRLQSSPK